MENILKRKKVNKINPYLTKEGRLISPPRVTRAMLDEEERKRQAKKRKSVEIKGIVNIEDLLSGEYWKRKELEEKKRQSRRDRKRMKFEEEKKIKDEKRMQ